MMLKTQRLSNSNAKVAYREQGQGPIVVLIHGVGMQSAAWKPQIEELSKSNRVIALDMPGHGSSDPLEIGSSLKGYVNWLDDFINALDITSISLVGHSMGALIAGGFSTTFTNKVERVALLNGVFRRSAEARLAVENRALEVQTGKIDLETPLQRWFSDSASDQAVRDDVKKWLSSVDPQAYATAYSAFAKGDSVYADNFENITCPFLALTSDGDPNSTPEMAFKMASLVKYGVAKTIKGHRHMMNLTAPEQVNKHLKVWLTETVQTKAVSS